MAKWISVGRGGMIDADRIMLIVPTRSAPIKQLLRDLDNQRVINMTYGDPRQAVVVFDNGYVAVTSLTVNQLMERIDT
jgi:regulator of extracellular matrix RemA (YlzA/DUF370 family)